MIADPRQGKAGAVGADKIADALRHWMGDPMTTIQVPAKCAARLGQCFSTTVDAARVDWRRQVVSVRTTGMCPVVAQRSFSLSRWQMLVYLECHMRQPSAQSTHLYVLLLLP